MEDIQKLITPPLKGRLQKPRTTGITMILDKGLSLSETDSLLQMSAPYIDFIKLSFGTAALYDSGILHRKIKMAAKRDVVVYPGGTFFEIAVWQNKAATYFQKLRELGFEWVEISDGTIEISGEQRRECMRLATAADLKIITEVGKKDPQSQPEVVAMAELATRDLEMGARWVIIEARESGCGIGIYDRQGGVIPARMSDLSAAVPLKTIIWEAPLKNQQAILINEIGPNVNLGNVFPGDAMALEALRLGYRNDTWKTVSAVE